LETTLIRGGNDDYAKQNISLKTLKNRHSFADYLMKRTAEPNNEGLDDAYDYERYCAAFPSRQGIRIYCPRRWKQRRICSYKYCVKDLEELREGDRVQFEERI
jgi:hypothetical protein